MVDSFSSSQSSGATSWEGSAHQEEKVSIIKWNLITQMKQMPDIKISPSHFGHQFCFSKMLKSSKIKGSLGVLKKRKNTISVYTAAEKTAKHRTSQPCESLYPGINRSPGLVTKTFRKPMKRSTKKTQESSVQEAVVTHLLQEPAPQHSSHIHISLGSCSCMNHLCQPRRNKIFAPDCAKYPLSFLLWPAMCTAQTTAQPKRGSENTEFMVQKEFNMLREIQSFCMAQILLFYLK